MPEKKKKGKKITAKKKVLTEMHPRHALKKARTPLHKEMKGED